jgi:hypothetical protein
MFRRRLLMAAAAVAAALCASSQARASFVLVIDVYHTSDLTTKIDSITENVPVAGFGQSSLTFQHSTPSGSDWNSAELNSNLLIKVEANSNNINPLGNPAQLQDVSTSVQDISGPTASGGNGQAAQNYTIVISLTDTGYNIPIGPNPMTMTSVLQWSAAGNPQVSGSFKSAADTGDVQFAKDPSAPGDLWQSAFTSSTAITTGTQNVGDLSLANTMKSVQFNRSGSYSLTNQYIINTSANMVAAASLTGTTEVWAAPAPGGLILAATALPFVGLLRRRLRAAAPTA